MCQQLVGFFSCCIQRYRVIYLVIGGIRHFFVGAIYAGAGGIYKMLYALGSVVIGVAAGFQYVVKANQVTFDVGIQVGDGITHACLCCQVYYYFRLVVGKDFVDECFVSQVALDEGPLGVAVLGNAGSNLLQTVLLDGYVVVVAHVVQTDDLHR